MSRGAEPIQTVKWLFQRRDELVHAAPRGPDLTYRPENHNPRELARCSVAVAEAASRLEGDVHEKSLLASVLSERQRLLDYGDQATDRHPDLREAPSDSDLLQEARRRASS